MEGCFAKAKNVSRLRWVGAGVVVDGLALPRLVVPWERDAGVGVDTMASDSMAGQFSSSTLKSRRGRGLGDVGRFACGLGGGYSDGEGVVRGVHDEVLVSG